MVVRFLLVAAMIVGLSAFGMSYLNPKPAPVRAQSSENELQATVEALQTQIAGQDARIAKLEEDVALLRAAVVQDGHSAPPQSATQVNEEETHVLSGVVALNYVVASSPDDLSFSRVDTGDVDVCVGNGRFSSVNEGMRIVVYDESGETIAVGSLGPGVLNEVTYSCQFRFSVEAIPPADFYNIEVGSLGDRVYTFDELEELNWKLGFALP